MKHILTTNEPFLLERNSDVYKDLTQATTVLRFEDLPWLSYTWHDNSVDDFLYLGIGIGYDVEGYDTAILAGYLEQGTTYSVDDTFSLRGSNLSKLGKILGDRFANGEEELMHTPMFFDLTNDKVYNIYFTSWDSSGAAAAQIKNVSDYKFNEDQIFSEDSFFGTKIYWKLGLLPYKEVPEVQLTSQNVRSPENWTYRLEPKIVYYDRVPFNEDIFKQYLKCLEEDLDISYWEGSEDLLRYSYYKCGNKFSGSSEHAWIYLTPSVYWDLTVFGNIDSFGVTTCNRMQDYYSKFFRKQAHIIGRFIAGINDIPIGVNYGDMIFPDTNPSIISGHTYEFNIFDGVFNLIDVTQTTT